MAPSPIEPPPQGRAFLRGLTSPDLTGELLTRISLMPDGSVARVPVPFAVDAPPDLLRATARGLPEGAAWPEAVAVRLAARGIHLEWQAPKRVSIGAMQRVARSRGSSSIEVIRADPSLSAELQVGGWFDAPVTARLARRVPWPLASGARHSGRRLLLARLERAFWQGARERATEEEWSRLARASYVVLLYHRIAGEGRREEERLDVPPCSFKRQMRLLRALRFHPVAPEELIAFHTNEGRRLPRRSYVVTADDGFVDALEQFRDASEHRPQMFIPTRCVGQVVDWAPGARIADWPEIVAAERDGVRVGSHARRHVALAGLPPHEVAGEVAGSLSDLHERLTHAIPVLAYPHGSYDERTRKAAEAAGYRAAYTTTPGRNAGVTDPFRLRRIGIKAWDNIPAFLWKVLTGTHLPRRWEERCLRRHGRRPA
jgi:Polysaccharide deacetylase